MKTQLTFAIYRKRIALLNSQPIIGIENGEGLFSGLLGLIDQKVLEFGLDLDLI